MLLSIESAENGYIIRGNDGHTQVIEAEGPEAARGLAYVVWSYFALEGNRHAEMRPYVVLAPGDKRDPLPICPFCDAPARESKEEEC